MERRELLTELRAQLLFREKELDLLHAIDRRLLSDDPPRNAIFGFIVEQTQALLGSDRTRILLRSGRFLESAYSTAKSDLGHRVDISTSLEGRSLTTGSTISIPDMTRAELDTYAPPANDDRPVKSLMITPITARHTAVGVLATQSEQPHAFGAEHENAFTAIAAQVAIATERAQLFDRDALFADIDDLMLQPGDSQQAINLTLRRVMRALQELTHVPVLDALILLRRSDILEVAYSTHPADVGLTLDPDRSIAGRAVRERRTVILDNAAQEPEIANQGTIPPRTESEIAIPIVFGADDGALGVLYVTSSEQESFQGFPQAILENFADKTRTLLAFAKLRADVTDALEIQHASELLIAIGDQTSNIIHRLNNTVGAMRVRIMQLQDLWVSDRAGAEDSMEESLAALRRLAERTLEMPDQVTALLREEGRKLDVNEAIQTALFSFGIPSDVTVRTNLADGLPQLSLYSFDIVIRNLIQNALDAMPEGGTLTISTSSFPDPGPSGGFVQIIVKDTGVGIADEVLPRIFELNFTTKLVKGRGMGLGLWWTRNFVRRAQGDISITSAVGQGTSVVVKLPFHSPAVASSYREGR